MRGVVIGAEGGNSIGAFARDWEWPWAADG